MDVVARRAVPDSGSCCAVAAVFEDGPCEHDQALIAQLRAEENAVLSRQIRRLRSIDPGELERLADLGDPLAEELVYGADADERLDDECRYPAVVPVDPAPSQALGHGERLDPGGIGGWETGRARVLADAATAGRFDGVRDGTYDEGAADSAGKDVSWVGMSPGPELAAILAAVDVEGLDRAGRIEVLAAWKRQEAWTAGHAAAAAYDLAREAVLFDHPDIPHDELTPRKRIDVTSEEIALRLAVSRHEALTLIRVGRGLTGTFSDTAAAAERGELDFRKARIIVTGLDEAPGPVGWMVEQDILPNAGGMTPAVLKREIQARLVEADPEDAATRHARARAKRHVTRTRVLADGMGSLTAVLPAQDCAIVDQTLTAIEASQV